MSHTPQPSRPVSRPHSLKLDALLKSLERSHENRQNSKAVPVKLTNRD